MAGRAPRRGPAPIASFDHDGSDEVRPPSSPDTKQAPRLPEIREAPPARSLAPPEPRARSQSTPTVAALGATPRIDISRASSSSHHDSRDSSPELALFAGDDTRARLDTGFREDGALDLRSSTEELAFLEGPGATPARAPRHHSRKDSQGSEAALLAVSGRTSRLSSVGSQCSAHSALSTVSRVSRLSAASGVSRSPSPHKMLLETSFCGPKPIEADPDVCGAALERRLLDIADASEPPAANPSAPPAADPSAPPAADARDRRHVCTEAAVERASPRVALAQVPPPTPAPPAAAPAPEPAPADNDKRLKENQNRARAQERRARPRVRREPSEPEVYKSGNRTKDIIRIKLKPDSDYEEDKEAPADGGTLLIDDAAADVKPCAAQSSHQEGPAARPTELVGRDESAASPFRGRRVTRESRTPSPAGPLVSRKSSFCSLFKSRETIASPDSPSDALRRKRSLTDGRSRSKSRERAGTPSSTGKLRGSVLSLFRSARRGAASPAPAAPDDTPAAPPRPTPADRPRRADQLRYYEHTADGIIHIPLRTPPDERPANGTTPPAEGAAAPRDKPRDRPRPASAPQQRAPPSEPAFPKRTVLPDGSIIIPLRSPPECGEEDRPPSSPATAAEAPRALADNEPSNPSANATPLSAAGNIECNVASDASDKTPVPTVTPDDIGWTERLSATGGSLSPTATDDIEWKETVLVTEVASQARPDEGASDVTSPGARGDEDEARRARSERILFTTHVGSRDQVFSTQLSITKTPSVASDISGSFPSFAEGEARARDSSESEASSGSGGASGAGSEAERRGLVVHESFEEELPYVPTTLPLERSLALPMVPVRERGGVRVRGVERPRPARAPPPCTPPRAPRPAAPRPAPPDRLRIRLPRRAPPAAQGTRAHSARDGGESRPKTDWIDFDEVPERKKQPKRIQTLPAARAVDEPAGAERAGGVVFSYVEPEQCRCECHAHARGAHGLRPRRDSTSSPECELAEARLPAGERPSRAGPRDAEPRH